MHLHWRSGWSLLGLLIVVAVTVVLVRLLSDSGGKGGES